MSEPRDTGKRDSEQTPPVIFISYAQEDEEAKDRLLPHFKQLEILELLETWNDQNIGHGPEWYADLKDRLRNTRFAICLISANYLSSRFCVDEEIPYLLQEKSRHDLEIIPILVSDCVVDAQPWLRGVKLYPDHDPKSDKAKSLAADYKKREWDSVFNEVAQHVYKALQPGYEKPEPAPRPGTPPEKEDIRRLPETGELLFGRRKEIQLLDEAWEDDSTNVVVLKAGGGVGKSTLTRVWTLFLRDEHYRDAERVFAWSFYSQGTKERVTSADAFIAEALDWFGDPDPTQGSPWDKGERLARLVGEQKTLLLLDGMEPLQSHLPEENGAIKDPGLQMLVQGLARENPGLCVISTRETVGDLTDKRFAGSVIHVDLDQVSTVAGRALMRVRGVAGENSALEETVELFDRHALAINLLASYLTEFEDSHITGIENLPAVPSPLPQKDGSRGTGEGEDSTASAVIHPAWRVVSAFEQQLDGTPELDVLRILGLFDRPISDGEFQAVTAEPPIPGLTDTLLAGTGSGTGLILPAGSSLIDRAILARLRNRGLITRESHHDRNEIDAHPLVREFFEERLKDEGGRMKESEDSSFILPPSSFREAHRRLYEHLKQSAPERPDNLNDMMPLYHAVAHGCKAGLWQEAYKDVLDPRIQRGTDYFSLRKLGALGTELAAFACFFERLWNTVTESVSVGPRISILNDVGAVLRGLGRLGESAGPLTASLDDDPSNGLA